MEKLPEHEAQFALIAQMIQTAKGQIRKGEGAWFLIWGYTICTASLLNYIFLQIPSMREKAPYAWALTGVAVVLSILQSRKERKASSNKTYLDDVVGSLWLGFVVSIAIIGINGVYLQSSAYPMLLTMYGIGLFVSGGIYKFLPLKIGGGICWLASMVAFHASFENQLLILAFALIAGYIIPGHLLQKHASDV